MREELQASLGTPPEAGVSLCASRVQQLIDNLTTNIDFCSIQPLMDNLESQTYEVFEKDPVKYSQYQQVGPFGTPEILLLETFQSPGEQRDTVFSPGGQHRCCCYRLTPVLMPCCVKSVHYQFKEDIFYHSFICLPLKDILFQ